MCLSITFKELRSRVRELKEHLLPKNFSSIGNYTERQQDRARGYRLLVHAEFESYLEDISRETITQAIREWKTDGKPSIIIVSFLASYHSSWNPSEEIKNEEILKIAKSRKNAKNSIDEIIDLAQLQFTQKLQENHGIKNKNFKTLILPLGVDVNLLDQTWLTNLDDFGSKRGEVAHNTKRTQGAINPKDEYDLVQKLLSGFMNLDKEIMRVRIGRIPRNNKHI